MSERAIVRRAPTAVTPTRQPDDCPERIHRADGITVGSQLSLGIDPRLQLSWRIANHYRRAGFVLYIFRSTGGFSAKRFPDDLNCHGSLILETSDNYDGLEERLAEGSYFYTFLLYKRTFFGLLEKASLVRFSEHIPSAKVAIGRIKDRFELQDLVERQVIAPMEHEIRRNEVTMRCLRSRKDLAALEGKAQAPENDVIAEALASVNASVESAIALQTKLEELQCDPRFQKLDTKTKRDLIQKVKRELDPNEASARRDMSR